MRRTRGPKAKISKEKEDKIEWICHYLKEVMPQEVEELPWDIDGNVIFKMKCEEDFWIDSVSDGRWWKVVQNNRKELEVERKFATCMGFLHLQ